MAGVGDLIYGAAQRYGQNPDDLAREAQIESGMDPAAHNASGASGLFQFMPSTAKQYGLTNPYDPAASADAAARLMRDNRAFLTQRLGRDPTGGELYLAHQQGAGGAATLITHPDELAANLVGTKAVIQNGGTQGMTARQFANLWTSKFGSASPVPGGASAGTPAVGSLYAAPTPDPAAVMAAAAPLDDIGLPVVPKPAPTVSNGGVQAAQEQRRRVALVTGQGGLGALFS